MTTPRLLTADDQRHALAVLTAVAAGVAEDQPGLGPRFLDGLTEDEAKATAMVLALWLEWQIRDGTTGGEDPAVFYGRLGLRIEACAQREREGSG